MPRVPHKKFYAVRCGREGPKIYDDWGECKKNTHGFSGASQKGFYTFGEAEQWIHTGTVVPIPFIPSAIPADPELSRQASSCRPRIRKELPRRSPSSFQAKREEVETSALQTFWAKREEVETSALQTFWAKREEAEEVDFSSNLLGKLDTPAEDSIAPENVEDDLPPVEPCILLSTEQQQVLDAVKDGRSIFFTGSAGTGKSLLLREIIRWCREQYRSLAVTASTGIASVNIGGSTLHSWAGIGLGKEPAEKLVWKILGKNRHEMMQEQAKLGRPFNYDTYDPNDPNDPMAVMAMISKKKTVDRWRSVQSLIIDEISMIDGKLFDKLEFIARVLRKSTLPFGGIQLIVSGDFCQLPPVPDQVNGAPVPATFAFDAKTWNSCLGRPICLKKVFRQKDQDFVDMLNAMRFGTLLPETIATFRQLSRRLQYTDGIEPTDLFSTRDEVDSANEWRLYRLKTEEHIYAAHDIPGYDIYDNPVKPDVMKKLLSRLVAHEAITLKEGAQVMLIKNLVQGRLVNGTIGKVVKFLTTREANELGIMIGLPDGETLLKNQRVPSWRIDRRSFSSETSAQDEAKQKLQIALSRSGVYPVVRFNQGSIHGGSVEVLCVPNDFEVSAADGRVEARREQVPLILAWALSIHKSQGQTLERVRVDLGSVFEKGQAYVALSRATSMETLEVRNFDPAKVVAHQRVLEWTRVNTNLVSDDLPGQASSLYEKDFNSGAAAKGHCDRAEIPW